MIWDINKRENKLANNELMNKLTNKQEVNNRQIIGYRVKYTSLASVCRSTNVQKKSPYTITNFFTLNDFQTTPNGNLSLRA